MRLVTALHLKGESEVVVTDALRDSIGAVAFNQRSGAQATPTEGNWEINTLISVIFLHPVFCPELPID